MPVEISKTSRMMLDAIQAMNPDAWTSNLEAAFWIGYKQRILEEMAETAREIKARRIDTNEKYYEDHKGER